MPAPALPATPRGPEARLSAATARLVLRKNQDRRLRGGHPWVFSNEVAEIVGAPADGEIVEIADFRNAFLGRAYYNRRSLICARVISRGRDEVDEALFVRRIERAVKLREAMDPGAAAARIVYGESDQLPGLVVDRYGDYLAVQVLTLGIEVRAEMVRAALEQVLQPRGVMRMADSPLRALEGLPLERGVWWGEVPEKIELTLDGLKLEVDLHHGQKTGLFLDQRQNRRHAETRARGMRVLDLYCYQGEWALHAARGGATEVLGVDSSAPALAAAKRNAERNGFADRVRFRQGDSFDVVRELEGASERFDMVILDPPALIKSRSQIAGGARVYRDINRVAMGLLGEGGTLITCSCSHHLDDALFRQVLIESARAAKRQFRVVEWTGEAPDHPQLLAVPETHYLKCAVLQAL
jgi:23S rRNA (cytosine1962-C5)-methyltransferase